MPEDFQISVGSKWATTVNELTVTAPLPEEHGLQDQRS